MIGMVLAAGRGGGSARTPPSCPRRCCPWTATARSSTSRSATSPHVGLAEAVDRHRLRLRADRRAPRGAGGAPRPAARDRLQPEGARVEQRLLAVVRARALRPRRAAGQRRHGRTPPRSRRRCSRRAGHRRPRARARPAQAARRGGDEGPRHRGRLPGPHQQGARPRHRAGRVHRRHADRAARRRAAGGRAGGDVPARPAPLLRGRLPGARRPRRPRRRSRRSARSSGSRSTTTRDLARAREVACRC